MVDGVTPIAERLAAVDRILEGIADQDQALAAAVGKDGIAGARAMLDAMAFDLAFRVRVALDPPPNDNGILTR